MSLKAELEIWAGALKAYDEEDFDRSLDMFSRIAESSKILTNMGLIYATIGEHELAVEQFNAATSLDKYLAVAYFQCGVSNFLIGRYPMALKDFEEALLYLRGNQAINYEQLGLKFKLFSAEVLFNKGLCLLYLNNFNDGMRDLENARLEKVTEEHSVIDDAIAERGEGYTVFSIPVGILYRPSENKLKNAKTKDYLGKARLVAAADQSDAYTTFTGVTRLQQGITPTGVKVDMEMQSRSDPNPISLPRPKIETVPVDPKTDYNQRSPVLPPKTEGLNINRSRSITAQGNGGRPMGLPARGNSIRRAPRADTPPNQDGMPPPPVKAAPLGPVSQPQPSRLTEVYDDLLDGYTQPDPAPPMPAIPEENKRIQAWARSANNAPPPPSRTPSMRAPSSYGGTSVGGVRRRGTKSSRQYGSSRGVSRVMSTYDEEDEGYRSGEYDEQYEMSKIRVKIHYKDDIRGMAIDTQMPFEEFVDKLAAKFERVFDDVSLRFKDDDGGRVTMRDESDYELAIETARENAKGRSEGKLEVWCDDR